MVDWFVCRVRGTIDRLVRISVCGFGREIRICVEVCFKSRPCDSMRLGSNLQQQSTETRDGSTRTLNRTGIGRRAVETEKHGDRR